LNLIWTFQFNSVQYITERVACFLFIGLTENEVSKEHKKLKHKNKKIRLKTCIPIFSVKFWRQFDFNYTFSGKHTFNFQFRPNGRQPMIITYWTVSANVSWKLSASLEVRWQFPPWGRFLIPFRVIRSCLALLLSCIRQKQHTMLFNPRR